MDELLLFLALGMDSGCASDPKVDFLWYIKL